MAEYEYQCARCGSTLVFEPCQVCPACGWFDKPDPTCSLCNGHGTVPTCISSPEWCEGHPLPGREITKRHTPEAFEVPREENNHA
ncbi:MAG: hypothetical protein JWO62_3352 [Acidimicrobiaceae bacterium]|jgi:hypothetical protein|nr:hypothetical protein [Acidimicrobiaceae bacterium]